MDKELNRWINTALLLAAIVCGTQAVEHGSFWLLAVATICAYSYTYFTENNYDDTGTKDNTGKDVCS